MTQPDCITILKEHRLEVLWWEICSILHDIGKLSSKFHEYRQTWETVGWGNDPHDHGWLTNDTLIPKELRNFFENAIPKIFPKHGTLSVIESVHQHTNDKTENRLVKILTIGDATDSRYDRNNPLISNEQTSWDGSIHPPYRGNVYGREHPVDLGALDKSRKEFYEELWNLFGKYAADGSNLSWDDYKAFKALCLKHFENAMSDTTRPSNDTALWEHVYGVTCVSKAVHAEDVTKDNLELERFMPFALYGVGIDTWRWCGQGHKIGDVTSRKKLVDDGFEKVKKLIEFDVAVGNCVYEDDSFQIFLIGRLDPADKLSQFLDQQVNACFGPELGAATVHEKEVNSTTHVVQVLDKLRTEIATPSTWQSRTPLEVTGNSDLCPVCRIRRIHKDKNQGVCAECYKRRTRITGFEKSSDRNKAEETPMLGEIADSHGRVALVVARFGLRDWLSGQMTRSCMITEPAGIKHLATVLPKIKELPDSEAAAYKAWLNEKPDRGYDDLRAELEALRSDSTKDTYALSVLARSPSGNPLRLKITPSEANKTWDSDLKSFIDDCPWLGGTWTEVDRLLNALCTKTPTPSTTLDVWSTTKEFFEQAVKGNEPWIQSCVEQRSRGWLEIDCIPSWLTNYQTLEIKGYGDEFLFNDSRLWVVQNVQKKARVPGMNADVLLIGDDSKEKAVKVTYVSQPAEAHSYWPYRTLTASPDVLMVLMPADRAPEFTRILNQKYTEEFGKVAGRLPLGIANIFFPKHLPMFSVLDTAWRVIDNFRRLQEGPWVERAYIPPATVQGLRLGNCERDSFHSYVITKSQAPVKSAFRTAAGWIAHREDLAEGTSILERPNLYDGIVLGGSGDRLNLNLTSEDMNSHQSPEQRTIVLQQDVEKTLFKRTGVQRMGLMTLQEFEECLSIWQSLKDTQIGDRPLRNLWFALDSRRTAWTSSDPERGEAALQAIGKTLGQHYLGKNWQRFESAFEQGLLEKTLQLHWAVLKEQLDN